MARAGMMWPPVPPPAINTRTQLLDLPRDVEQHANQSEHDEERRSAIGDEREGDALCRHQREHDADIKERLNQNGRRDPESEKARKRIFGENARANTAIAEDDEKPDNDQRAEQTKLFGNICEDVVRVRLRQVEELLPSLHVAQTAQAAGSHSDERLNNVKALAQWVRLRIHKCQQGVATPLYAEEHEVQHRYGSQRRIAEILH